MVAYTDHTAQVVLRARRHEVAAWHELVASHSPRLLGIARTYQLNDADAADVVQTTWLRCLQHLDQLRDLTRVGPWLVTICRREALRTLRGTRAVPLDPSDPTGPLARLVDEDRAPDPREGFEQQVRVQLAAAIARLPDRQRRLLTALLVAEHRGGGYADVASALDMPMGSIGPTRRRALRRLSRDRSLAALDDELACC